MMIRPGSFIEIHKNKSYSELLPIRDKLLDDQGRTNVFPFLLQAMWKPSRR